jgi:LysM repeat protein
MREVSQALWGVLAAIMSSIIVFGGLALSLAESGVSVASVFTDTPIVVVTVATQKPGEPTFTPSPTLPPTPTPTEPVFEQQCDYPPDWIVVIVDLGDTLESVAANYNVSVDELRKGNCWTYDMLMTGMKLHVPAPAFTATPLPSDTPTRLPNPTKTPIVVCSSPYGWVIYIVRPGDTLYKIALAHFTTYQELMRRNCLTTTTIRVGQRLYVPYIPPSSTPVPYFTPTFVPPTAISTPVRPTATRVYPTNTPFIPTETPVILPTETTPPPTWTNTPPPLPSITPTAPPIPTSQPTDTPIPSSPTPLPLPTGTPTSIPLPTDTSAPRVSLTPFLTISPPVP